MAHLIVLLDMRQFEEIRERVHQLDGEKVAVGDIVVMIANEFNLNADVARECVITCALADSLGAIKVSQL